MRDHAAVLVHIRAFGLAYPGAHTKSPWDGHLDLAVSDKTFAYLSLEGQPFSVGCKLPRSALDVMELPNANPTSYGLGKWGWVTVRWAEGEDVPVSRVERWIDESYRAQAQKRLLRELDGLGHGPR